MIYLDSSALVKLVVREPESAHLKRWLAESDDRDHVTSALGRVELMRTALRSADPKIIAAAQLLLDDRLDVLRLTDEVMDTAESIGPAMLRSLDAIHLASASALGSALTAVVAYDARLIEGCRQLELRVETPGLTPTAG